MLWNEIIFEKRKAKAITMSELSAKTGIDQSLISKYENAQRMPTDTHLKAISDALLLNLAGGSILNNFG